jgi:hypothetical protein
VKNSKEKAHASPPNVFDDPKSLPPAGEVRWMMWPTSQPHLAREFWSQSWYSAREKASVHFGVPREHIRWEL